jgi:CheY-like chemotaxis protein
LNRTRRLILEQHFDVTVVEALPEAVPLVTERRFALVLLCYSLGEDDCRTVVELVRDVSPETKILALAEGRERLELRAQDEVYLFLGPAELLTKTASMVGVRLEPTKHL